MLYGYIKQAYWVDAVNGYTLSIWNRTSPDQKEKPEAQIKGKRQIIISDTSIASRKNG